MSVPLKSLSCRTGAFLLTAFLVGCLGDEPPMQEMTTATTITIINTGATNLIGYRIVIGQKGDAVYESGDGSGRAALPANLAEKLMRDVAAAKPLAALPPGHCMKSASFGTSTFIVQGSDRSPDLSCPGNDAAQALVDDIAALAGSLHLRNVPRGQGRELPPQNF